MQETTVNAQLKDMITGGAGGARTHDRRIMSPDRQHLASGCLTWEDIESRDHARADSGTHLA